MENMNEKNTIPYSANDINNIMNINKELEMLTATNMSAEAIASKYNADQLAKLMAIVGEQLQNTSAEHLTLTDLASRILLAGLPHTKRQVAEATAAIGVGLGSGFILSSLFGTPLSVSIVPILTVIPVVMMSNAVINDLNACHSAGQRIGRALHKINPLNWRK